MSLTSVEMHGISDNEITRMQEWAVLNEDKKIFRDIESTETTYWKARCEEKTYIMMYDFKTVPEFEKLCAEFSQMLDDREIQRVISVAVFKNSPRKSDIIEQKEKKKEGLPMYIYAF